MVFSFYQTKPEFTINLGSSEDYSFVDGFYAQEKSDLGKYRWNLGNLMSLHSLLIGFG